MRLLDRVQRRGRLLCGGGGGGAREGVGDGVGDAGGPAVAADACAVPEAEEEGGGGGEDDVAVAFGCASTSVEGLSRGLERRRRGMEWDGMGWGGMGRDEKARDAPVLPRDGERVEGVCRGCHCC